MSLCCLPAGHGTMAGMTTHKEHIAAIERVTADLEALEDLRTRYLHKRALVIAAAFESDMPRMAIANAAGVTQARTYAIAAMARGISPASERLPDAAPAARLLQADDVRIWDGQEDSPSAEWIAFPYIEVSDVNE